MHSYTALVPLLQPCFLYFIALVLRIYRVSQKYSMQSHISYRFMAYCVFVKYDIFNAGIE